MSQLTLADCWPRRFPPSSLALQFCEDPSQAEQPLFAESQRRRGRRPALAGAAGLVVPGSYRQLRICRRSARILPRAAGRYGFAAPAAVWCPGAGHYQP